MWQKVQCGDFMGFKEDDEQRGFLWEREPGLTFSRVRLRNVDFYLAGKNQSSKAFRQELMRLGGLEGKITWESGGTGAGDHLEGYCSCLADRYIGLN